MLPRIGGVIAEAAMSAFRRLGANGTIIAVAPIDPAVIARCSGGTLNVTNVALIRIEINLNPSR
jgi:hypothetical protein